MSNDRLILLVIKHGQVGVREKVSKIKAYRLTRLGRAVAPSFLAELLGPLAYRTKDNTNTCPKAPQFEENPFDYTQLCSHKKFLFFIPNFKSIATMADSNVFRATTTAPVNIAVIKYDPRHFPDKKDSTSDIQPQILGKTRCDSEPTHKFFSLRHPLSEIAPHRNHRIMLAQLPRG